MIEYLLATISDQFWRAPYSRIIKFEIKFIHGINDAILLKISLPINDILKNLKISVMKNDRYILHNVIF